MRSVVTWLVAGALLAIALAAGVDALRGDAPSAQPPSAETEDVRTDAAQARPAGPPRIEDSLAVRAELEVAEISGTLYLTDGDCRLWALELPFLTWRQQGAASAPDCRFALSPTERRALFGDAGWHPSGDLGAVERDGRIEVSSVATGWSFEFEGSKPAFRPDGALTYVRGRTLWGWVEAPCRPGEARVEFRSVERAVRCARLLLPRGVFERAFRGGFAAVQDPMLAEAVWLDGRTVVVLVHGQEAGHGIAVLVDGKVSARHAAFVPQVSDLEASPRGTRVAYRADSVLLFDRNLQDAGFGADAHAIAWPPDQRFTLVATESSVHVLRPGETMIQIPVDAADIAWADP
jgi:hypothetical protein